MKRISLATSLYRTAMSGLLDAAREVKDAGTFGYVDRSIADTRSRRLHAGLTATGRSLWTNVTADEIGPTQVSTFLVPPGVPFVWRCGPPLP